MKTPALITPSVMKWARETAGLSVEDVASRLTKSITPQIIENWESGKEMPTYPQLRKIAETYRRPVIAFYFPEPPKEDSIEKRFRTLPKAEAEKIPPKIHFLIRRADTFRLNLHELHEEQNPIASKIFSDIPISPSLDMKKAAAEVRRYLNLPEAQQWKTADKAFDARRDCLEQHGLSIFKEPFRGDDYSGFCLNDRQFPVIYINNSMSKSRQSFTLFHELGHILMKTGGVDFRDYRNNKDTAEEVACNQFAGEVLVPEDEIKKYLPAGKVFDDKVIESLAERYKVSRDVILRKLLDLDLINRRFFNQKTSQFQQQWADFKKSQKSGPVRYASLIYSYRSKNYTQAAYLQYCRDLIDRYQFADYLKVKMRHVDSIAKLALRDIRMD